MHSEFRGGFVGFRNLIFLIALSASSVAGASSMDAAIEAYASGKYKDSAAITRELSEKSPRAKGFLCQHYFEGFLKGDDEGRKVCEESVVAKDPIATYLYARALLEGNENLKISKNATKGMGFMAVALIDSEFPPAYEYFCEYYYARQDAVKAASFCKIAASSSMRRAAYRMSEFYSVGTGVIQDYGKAFDLLLVAAKKNFSPAYESLGDIFKDGTHGKKKDVVQAYAWYTLALAVNNEDRIHKKRNSLSMPPDGIPKAQLLAKSWVSANPRLTDYYGK